MTCTDSHRLQAPPRTHSFMDGLNLFERTSGRIIETLWLWAERARQRRQLSQLTSGQMHDIGLSHSEAAFEADKPFWKD